MLLFRERFTLLNIFLGKYVCAIGVSNVFIQFAVFGVNVIENFVKTEGRSKRDADVRRNHAQIAGEVISETILQ